MDSIKFEQHQSKVPVIVAEEVKLVSEEIAEKLTRTQAQFEAFVFIVTNQLDDYETLSPSMVLLKAQNDAAKSKNIELRSAFAAFGKASVELMLMISQDTPATDEAIVEASINHIDAATELLFLTHQHTVREVINPSCKSWVYFMLNEDRNIVKIGYSCNPEWRVNTFRAGTLDKLTILKAIPGGRTKEAEMHKTFAKYRINKRKELFKYEGELKAYIDSLE
jgi:hypothetical protein